jgi:hypothetical protein
LAHRGHTLRRRKNEAPQDSVPVPRSCASFIGWAAQLLQLVCDKANLRDQLKKYYSFENIIGTSEST